MKTKVLYTSILGFALLLSGEAPRVEAGPSIGPAGHALDYFQCATEGDGCSARLKYVAYGANGKFLFRTSFSTASIPCTSATFGGDPAPGVVKACYASIYEPTIGEGSSGSAGSTPRNMAYGAKGVFNFRVITGSYTCNNATFGDPIPGVAKACYEALPSYAFGANEGSTMTGLFNTPVAFGANGKFVFKVVTGSAPCTNAFFGSDPAPGVSKICYQFQDGGRIADEGQHFNAGGPYIIFYGSGLNGNFLSGSPRGDKPSQASGTCDNATFGGDPHIGERKHCYSNIINPPNSCGGHCGTQAPGGCWCDSACMSLGDCCADFTQQDCF